MYFQPPEANGVHSVAVERRRRDKINNWIVQLSKLVPDCAIDQTKQGQVSNTVRGQIGCRGTGYLGDMFVENS